MFSTPTRVPMLLFSCALFISIVGNMRSFGQIPESAILGTWARDHKATIEFAETEATRELAKMLLKETDLEHLLTFEKDGKCAMTVEIENKETSRFPATWRIKTGKDGAAEIEVVLEIDVRKNGQTLILTKKDELRSIDKNGKCVIVYRRHNRMGSADTKTDD